MDIDGIIGKDEQVIEEIHRHWVNVLPGMAGFIVICAVSLIGFYFLGRYSDTLSHEGVLVAAALGLGAMLALGLVLAYASWVVYRQNILIITNKNLYQVTQDSLFSRRISQFSLGRLQDVSASQDGVLASLLGFGDVTVETASAEENFVFYQAPHPHTLSVRIMECHKLATDHELAEDGAEEV